MLCPKLWPVPLQLSALRNSELRGDCDGHLVTSSVAAFTFPHYLEKFACLLIVTDRCKN